MSDVISSNRSVNVYETERDRKGIRWLYSELRKLWEEFLPELPETPPGMAGRHLHLQPH